MAENIFKKENIKQLKEKLPDWQNNLKKVDVKKGFTKAGETLEKAAGNAKDTAQVLVEKVKDENLKAQLKKYNPVFQEDYDSPEFNLPNVIIIVDDAVRKDIEVCRGAIGWLSKENNVEIFHLYDEVMNSCGLQFIPAASCDTAYYVDPHDRNCFIKIDSFYERVQQSMLAELQRIAFSLGAKRYSVELINETEKHNFSSRKATGRFKTFGGSIGVADGVSSAQEIRKTAKSLASAEYTSSRAPVEPTLKWFAHDDNIKGLIETVCSGECTVKVYDIMLSGSDYSGMSQGAARKVEGALSKNSISIGADFENKAVEMNSYQMVFHLEF